MRLWRSACGSAEARADSRRDGGAAAGEKRWVALESEAVRAHRQVLADLSDDALLDGDPVGKRAKGAELGPCAIRYNAGMRALHVGISQVFSLHHLHERESRRGAAEHATRDAPRAAGESPERHCLCTAVPCVNTAACTAAYKAVYNKAVSKALYTARYRAAFKGHVQAVSQAADHAVNTAAMYKSV